MRKGMAGRVAVSALALVGLLDSTRATGEPEHHAAADDPPIVFSAELSALLSEEMLAIEEGLGPLMAATAAGDWSLVTETAAKLEKSYILAQRLTPEQREELQRVLPPRFKSLDSAFHESAGKHAKAAEDRDAELALFHSYKLMETCFECHATYAKHRFPGFANPHAGAPQPGWRR